MFGSSLAILNSNKKIREKNNNMGLNVIKISIIVSVETAVKVIMTSENKHHLVDSIEALVVELVEVAEIVVEAVSIVAGWEILSSFINN